MEDKKEHDLKQRELQAQIVELSISVDRCVPSPFTTRIKGVALKGITTIVLEKESGMKTLSGDHGIQGWIFHYMTGSSIPWVANAL